MVLRGLPFFINASSPHTCVVYLFAFGGRPYTDSFAYMVPWYIPDCETFRDDESNLKPILPIELCV